MKLETFFNKFDLFADAPNAVAKMRELVLRMATSGRIAEQDSADQPSSELLKEIFTVRDGLIKRGAAKSRIEGSPISAGDTIDLPPSWARCMISEVCDLQTGATPSRMERSYFGGDTPWLVSGDINKGEITECDGRITEEGLENSNCKIIHPNSVLIALNGQGKTRATVAVLRIPAALNQSLVAMIPYSGDRLLPEYIFWNLRGRYYAIRDITGQDQRRGLNMKLVAQLTIPIPPLAEQKRIVEKVDELMALCDRLEAQQQERETRHAALVRASLARFADAPIPANLQFLFHPSNDIPPADLRKSILTLAVQGKLVPQDPNDEPAVNNVGPNGELSAQTPFEIPEQWTWTQLSQLADINGGFAFKSTAYTEEGMRVVRISDFDEFGFKDHKVVRHPFSPELQKFALAENNILMAMTGGTVGKSYFVRSLPETMVVNQRVATIKVLADLSPSYIDIAIKSAMTQEVIRTAKNSTNDNISMNDIKGFTIPLPPLAEQHRIVAKVDQLMALVDKLEIDLVNAKSTSARLLEALISELTQRRAAA